MYLDVYERDTSRYDQDTCKIHRNTSGYVSDRKPPPKRIGNPTSPMHYVSADLASGEGSDMCSSYVLEWWLYIVLQPCRAAPPFSL